MGGNYRDDLARPDRRGLGLVERCWSDFQDEKEISEICPALLFAKVSLINYLHFDQINFDIFLAYFA